MNPRIHILSFFVVMIMLSLLFIGFVFIVNKVCLIRFMLIFACFLVFITPFSEFYLVILIVNASPFSNHIFIEIILFDFSLLSWQYCWSVRPSMRLFTQTHSLWWRPSLALKSSLLSQLNPCINSILHVSTPYVSNKSSYAICCISSHYYDAPFQTISMYDLLLNNFWNFRQTYG